MKVLGVLLCVLSFHVYADDFVCKSGTRATVNNVKVKDLGNGKVDVNFNQTDYFGDSLTDLDLVGYQLKDLSNGPIFTQNPEVEYNLVDENGNYATMIISKINMGASTSRVPCHHARVILPHCNNGPQFTKTIVNLKSDKLDTTFYCN